MALAGVRPGTCGGAAAVQRSWLFGPMLRGAARNAGKACTLQWARGDPVGPCTTMAAADGAHTLLQSDACRGCYTRRRLQSVRCSAGSDASGPLTEEQLREMTTQEEQQQEAALGDAWRQQFEGDLDHLHDYVRRDGEDWQRHLEAAFEVPRAMRERTGAMLGLDALPAGMATGLIGMGTWRLRSDVDPTIAFLAGRIEGSLRELLEDDLTLYPPDKWKAKGWDFLDSMDPAQEWDGWAWSDIPNPPEDDPAYPRLQVENRVYCSRVFRKLHLEVAVRQDGLQVLHVVFYPRYDFDIPILAFDVVLAGGRMTLAVADACPLSPNLRLPQHYMQTMSELQEAFLPEPATSRRIPDWGKAIFSPLTVCMRPETDDGVVGFLKYTVALTRVHLMYSALLSPVEPRTKAGARRLAELASGHKRFVTNQLANKKTSRVLEVAFGAELTTAYMEGLMFDCDLTDNPPWYDSGLRRLYRHFEESPEPWKDGEKLLAIRQRLDVDKARTFLQRFVEGEASISGERLQFALATLYDADQEFQDAANASTPELLEMRVNEGGDAVGKYLEQQLLELVGSAAAQQQQQQQSKPAAPASAAGGNGGQQQQQQPGA